MDDASGKQLVAEVTHTGKKKDAAIQCCLESCRILEARGVLRQEAGEASKRIWLLETTFLRSQHNCQAKARRLLV